MKEARSVSDGLVRGLNIVGLLGGLTLLAITLLGFEAMLYGIAPDLPWRNAVLDIFQDVGLPLIVLMIPIYISARLVIRSSLRPLSAAAQRMDTVTGTERGFRLELADLPTEVLPFARAVNNLLGRLDEIAWRREAFAAEAAHELRTPLAILMLELDALGSADGARLKADVAGMSRLLDLMLLMARLDAHAAAPLPDEVLSLLEIASDVTARLAPIAVAQGKELELEIIDRKAVRGRREALAAAIRNLVENALQVTPPNGTVTVVVGPGALIRVRDGGTGLATEDLERLSGPDGRAARKTSDGTGLGLVIVARIMAVHGGELSTDPLLREIRLFWPEQPLEASNLDRPH